MTERDPHAAGPEAPSSSGPVPPPPAGPVEPPSPSTIRLLGLRLRIWAACLSGAVVSVAALWWIAGTQITVGSDPATLLAWLIGAGTLGIVIGTAAAMWLDHGIVLHLRGLTRGFASGRVQELRGLPAASGWGELSELTEWAAVLITRQRVASRAAADLEKLEAALALTFERLEAWRSTERWEALPADEGTAGAIARGLNDTFARLAELSEQNLEAARRVRAELVSAATDARESAALAERGFVEATALLTTVRELQRLGQELRHALHAAPPVAAVPAGSAPAAAATTSAERLHRYRASVEAAVEDLVASSDASIEHLGATLERVQEIAAQVQVVSQRATLVALHAVTLESRLPAEERRDENLARELRLLTTDVRDAAARADALAADVERETRSAGEQMRESRQRVGPQLELPAEDVVEAPAPAPPAPAALSEQSSRLLERVREMIQDATQKGERLSAAGERASRSAERLLRRIDEESRELEGLMLRLAPPQESADAPPAPSAGLEPHPAPAELRLLDSDATAAPAEPAESEGDDDVTLGAREERP